MTQTKPEDTDSVDRRYSDICGATNNRGKKCKLPAGWGTPGSGGTRCKFHGGCSTGPKDTEHLEGNTHAAGNPGGGPPALNTNAKIHGGFTDWKKVYQRLDDEKREYVETLVSSYIETAAEDSEVGPDQRECLAREYATLSIIKQDASADAWCDPSGDGPGRGFVVDRELDVAGETVTVQRRNPAFRAEHSIRNRRREIAETLRLWSDCDDNE